MLYNKKEEVQVVNIVVNGHNIFLIIGICFIASIIFVFVAKKVAEYTGVLDIPNERKVHKKPIPLLGGIGIFLSFLLGYMLFAPKSTLMLSILIASFLILLLGIFDDIKPIRARYKLLVHVLVASIIVFYGGLVLNEITVLGLYLNFHAFAPIVTIFIIIATINAINLIDGLDGLCAGVSSIYFFTISIIAIILNKFGGLDIILSLIMLGSTLGFLVYNFPPAKIFMGDTGSTFLGLMISIIMLLGFKTVTITSLVIPLLILALPILDTIFAIIRRTINKKPLGEPDKNHIHHELLKKQLGTTKSLLIIYAINIVFSITSIFYALGHHKETIICYVLLIFILIFLIFKTNIIFDREKGENKK